MTHLGRVDCNHTTFFAKFAWIRNGDVNKNPIQSESNPKTGGFGERIYSSFDRLESGYAISTV